MSAIAECINTEKLDLCTSHLYSLFLIIHEHLLKVYWEIYETVFLYMYYIYGTSGEYNISTFLLSHKDAKLYPRMADTFFKGYNLNSFKNASIS